VANVAGEGARGPSSSRSYPLGRRQPGLVRLEFKLQFLWRNRSLKAEL